MEKEQSKIKLYVKEHERELEELLLSLARIPAPTGQEERRAAFCRRWLEAHGAEGVYTDRAGNVIWAYQSGACTGNVICQPGNVTAQKRDKSVTEPCEKVSAEQERNTIGSDSREYTDQVANRTWNHAPSVPVIVFTAHMDVVFPDTEELPLFEQDGKIFCPGVGDDTANLAVLLMAAAFTAEYRPDTGGRELLFVCGTGEEGLGNLRGSREICSAFGPRIEAFYALDLTMESYLCRAVGSLRYRILVTAQGGHSYHCFGRTNANAVLAELITALYRLQVPVRGNTTYNVGVISGGTSVNTIAQRAECLYEIRSDDAQDLYEMREKFQNLMEQYRKKLPEDCQIQTELIGERPCEKEVDEAKRQQLFAYVETAVEAACGRRPDPKPFSTDCNIPLSMGIPSVCVGTCRGAGAHTREEYIEKDSLADGLQILLTLLGNYMCEVK